MSKRSIVITNFFLLFVFITSLFITPQANKVYAAEPCIQTKTATGQFIQFSAVDSSGSTLLQIPEGATSINIKFSNLEPGYYRLAYSKASFAPKVTNLAPYYTEPVQANNGTVTLTIDDLDLLKNGDHIGNLQFSSSNDFNNLKIPRPYNEQYCSEVKYTIGYPKESCTLKIIPDHPTSNQQFLLDISNAPTGQYGIIKFNNLIPSIFKLGPDGTVSIDNTGKATSELFGPLAPGKYQIGLLALNLLNVNDASAILDVTKYNESFMCRKDLEIVVANAGPALPTCSLSQSSTEYKIRAFNLTPNTNYDVTLDSDSQGTISLGSQNSGSDNRFDVSLLNGASPITITPGQYTGSIKDANGAGCGVAFSIDSAGNLAPGSTSTVRLCKKGDNNPLCSQSGSQTCIPPYGGTTSGIPTAIGCIPTEPTALVKAFLTFIIAISGGIAFLLMLIGAFGMLTSAGNPDNLAQSRDRFVKAIEGLLFVIFAVLLMKIIGVDILGLGQYLGF